MSHSPSPGEQLRDRRVQADLTASGRLGTPLHLQSAAHRFEADAAARAIVTGPRRYMTRLRRIEQGIDDLLASAQTAWGDLARRHAHDAVGFGVAWRAWVASVETGRLNRLIDAHNRYYPAEANLPMSIHTGDYMTFDGRDYRHEPVDATWLLARFPADLTRALAGAAPPP